MKILVLDVGGKNVKMLATDQTEVRKFPSGRSLSAHAMVRAARALASDWEYDVISIGFPGPVVEGKPSLEPHNLGHGWVDCDFAAAFDKPVKVINDAAMQALGSYEGGRMLFLGLGTGVGSTLIVGKVIIPLDVGQLPFRNRVFDDLLSRRALRRLGKTKWNDAVFEAVAILKHCFLVDYVMLGGGNVKKLRRVPPGARLGENSRAFLGGYRLWNMSATLTPASHPPESDVEPPRSEWKLV
jgi:hypothetical protein